MAPDPLAAIERQQLRDINLLFRTLADSIRNAVADLPGDQPITTFETAPILQAIDQGLDVMFGGYHGDPEAALRQVIVRDANRAALVPLDEAVQRYRKALPGEIVERLEADRG